MQNKMIYKINQNQFFINILRKFMIQIMQFDIYCLELCL